MKHTLRNLAHEWGYFLAAPVRWYRNRHQTQARFAKDRRDVAHAATALATGVGTGIVGAGGHVLRTPVYLVRGPLWAVRRFLELPWKVRGAFAGLALAGLGAVGSVGYRVMADRAHFNLISGLTADLTKKLNERDRVSCENILRALVDNDPGNDRAAARLHALEVLDAPASDPPIARLVMHRLRELNEVDKAAEHARRLIQSAPSDWEARCYLAEQALHRRDADAVREHVASLPNALTVPGGISLPHILYSLQLFGALNDQGRIDELLEVAYRNWIPATRLPVLMTYPPVVRIQFAELYDQLLKQLTRRPQLLSYWVPVQELCQTAAEDPDLSPPLMAHLGKLSEAQILHLETARAAGLLTDAEVAPLRKEVEARLSKLWPRLQAADPNQPLGYQGAAMLAMRAGRPADAIAAIDAGLAKLGPKPELVDVKARVLRLFDPQAGLQFLEHTLADENVSVSACQSLAEAALSAGRPDKARQACRKALALDPNAVWACQIVGEIAMAQEQPSEAAAALGRIKPLLPGKPQALALYVKALYDCGGSHLADEFLEGLVRDRAPIPALLAGVQALRAVNRPDVAVAVARRAADIDPLDIRPVVVQAEILRAKAERPDGTFEREPAAEALRLFRQALLKVPNDLQVVAEVVWLELVALNQPKLALTTAAPLADHATDGSLSAGQLETLGATLLANDQPDAARKALETAARRGNRPSQHLLLAQAYAALNQRDLAEQALKQAGDLPNKTPREIALFTETKKVIRKPR